MFLFVFRVTLTALICYSAVRRRTLTSQVCSFSTVRAESARVCVCVCVSWTAAWNTHGLAQVGAVRGFKVGVGGGVRGRRWTVAALLFRCVLPECVQLYKAALSCRVTVGAGSSGRGGSSEAEAPLSAGQISFLRLFSPVWVSALPPAHRPPALPLRRLVSVAPGWRRWRLALER